jgi:hypothetical protein
LVAESIVAEHNNPHKVKMNYNNYERGVVERYGVDLVSWPATILPIHNLSTLGGRTQVHVLLDALTKGTCHWKKLTENELVQRIQSNTVCQARGEQVYKPRKKHVAVTVAKSATTVDTEDDEEEEEEDNDD